MPRDALITVELHQQPVTRVRHSFSTTTVSDIELVFSLPNLQFYLRFVDQSVLEWAETLLAASECTDAYRYFVIIFFFNEDIECCVRDRLFWLLRVIASKYTLTDASHLS